MSAVEDFTLPSNPEDIKRIKNAIMEASAQKQMIKDRQEAIKDIKNDLKERYDLPPKLFGQLVKAHHDQCYDKMTVEHSKFELTYETLMGIQSMSDDEEEEDTE